VFYTQHRGKCDPHPGVFIYSLLCFFYIVIPFYFSYCVSLTSFSLLLPTFFHLCSSDSLLPLPQLSMHSLKDKRLRESTSSGSSAVQQTPPGGCWPSNNYHGVLKSKRGRLFVQDKAGSNNKLPSQRTGKLPTALHLSNDKFLHF
jgi:hypothetical protein